MSDGTYYNLLLSNELFHQLKGIEFENIQSLPQEDPAVFN